MKLLIVITRGDSIGGAQTHVLSLAKLFKADGHDVLICYGGEIAGPFYDLLKAAELNCCTISTLKRQISPKDDVRTIFKLRKLYKQFKPDIISLHSSKAGILGRLSALGQKIPVVLTIHGWAFTEGVNKSSAEFYKFLEKKLSRFAAKIIVVSQFDKDIATKYGIASADKMIIVHNGIEVLCGIDHETEQSAYDANLVMVARFDKQKDHQTVVEACVNLKNYKVHFIGDGPNEDYIKSLTKNLNIDQNFTFHGYQRDVPKFLKKADIFMLISNWEGFPISTLEAMNYSLPVVVSNVGGAKEAVIDEKTGYLIPRNNSKFLKLRLEQLIKNKQHRLEMGAEGRKHLELHFSDVQMYSKVLNVFEQLKS